MLRGTFLSVCGLLLLAAMISGCDMLGPTGAVAPATIPTATVPVEAVADRDIQVATATAAPAAEPTPTPDRRFWAQALSFSDPEHGWVLGLENEGGNLRLATAAMRATTDGGQTWHAVPAPQATVDIHGYGREPGTIRHIELANTGNGWAFGPSLYSTHDGGLTWAVEPTSGAVVALEHRDGSVWAIERSCKKVSAWLQCAFNLKTSDNMGRTWEDLANQPPTIGTQVQLARISGQVAYLYSGGEMEKAQPSSCGYQMHLATQLVKTSDGGKTWQNLGQPTNFPCEEGYLRAASEDVLWLLCTTTEGVGNQSKSALLTEDGGKNWRVVAQTQSDLAGCPAPGAGDLGWTGYVRTFAAQSADRAYVSVDGRGLMETTDGGRTWETPHEGPRGDADVKPAVVFVDPLHGWFADGEYVVRTTDGGTTWTRVEVR
jgi:photosystem II stability/assembly factor-like uncharacterized protein